MDDEFKKKAADALKAGADAAKKIGGIACDLGKRGIEAARDKAREMGEKARERAEAQKQAESESSAASRSASRNKPMWRGDPEDKHFEMSRGWLYFIWWLVNIIYTILCLMWFASSMNSYRGRDSAWIPLVVLFFALLFNRLGYEAGVAIFEMVKHLRQIRDELRRHNMREEERDRKAISQQTTAESANDECGVTMASTARSQAASDTKSVGNNL